MSNAKIVSALVARAATTPVTAAPSWQANMIAVIKSVDPKIAARMEKEGKNGFEISVPSGKAILDAFRKAKFKPFDQTPKFWVVDSDKDNEEESGVGVAVDMQVASTCSICFYNDN